MNELINELYAKLENQEKIIRELQEEIERQSKAQVILDNQNSELYGALLDIKELFTNYEELEKVIGAGKPRFPLYKVQRIVNKALNEEEYKLPFDDEVMSGLDSLSIRSEE